MDSYQRYGLWLFGIAVVVLVVGAVVSRGDADIINVSGTDIVINTEGIRVGEDELSRIGIDGYRVSSRGI